METDSIAVAPSEENGNTPIETPSEPIAPIAPVAPTEPTEPVTPTEPTVELFELPDGRKVDAGTLTKEWKENFLPDYTRKSQELAKVKPETLPNNEPAKNKYEDPTYVPQSYEEILKVAESRALDAIEKKEQSRIEAAQAIENTVASQLAEVKKTEPDVNENALFLHATKYGFRDLKLAHQNMKDMSDMAKKVADTTVKNIAKRNDPVSITPGGTGNKPNPRDFLSATDYLRSLNK